jgi:lipopolysaccharide/colanic/teichoic acid biosynthesis glycosyltransferase
MVNEMIHENNWAEAGQRALELFAAALLLVLSAPIVAVAALLVKLTSRGPVFYAQTRLGRAGNPYRMYKIRSMTHNCEGLTGARWATRHDPRVTAVGRFLRRSKIDELPQLWNVLGGEMSLVGPRPERPEFVPQLERAIPRYRERLRIRPGLTGLAQIQLPADTDLASVRRKLAYDLYYVRHKTLLLDAQILLATGLYVLGIPFAVSRALFRVPSGRIVEKSGPSPAVQQPSPVAV